MNSVTRISFFMVLSLGLHILSLPVDFLLPEESPESHQVGIGYVSRSLDSFYTPLDRTVSAPFEQPQESRKKNKSVTEIRSVSPIVKPKQKEQLPKTITVAVEPIPVEIVDELDPAVPDTQLLAEDIPIPETTQEPPMSATVKTSFQSEGKVVQTGQSIDSSDPIPLTDGENGSSLRGFKDALPRYDVNPYPRYPRVAKLRGWEGMVVFEAQILKNGRVGHLQVVTSSGYKSLDDAARKAINRWKFSPATSFGMSIDSQVEIPVTFSLKNL